MASTVTITRTGNQDIDGLFSGAGWNTPSLTYSFPTNSSYYGGGYGSGEPQDHFGALNATQVKAARSVLAMISSVTNLDFTQVDETSTTHATLRLAVSDTPYPAWSYLPDSSDEAGDTWFSRSNGWYDTPVKGGYGYYAFIHEILHAVGLKHGNESSGFGAMTAPHDSMEFSVMTYRSYVGAAGQYVENETWGYAQSLMMYDIAALQQMYGADFSTNSGSTIYRWNPATGEETINGIAQGAPGGNRVFLTVWDGGGNDTYDLSNYTTNLSIDLRPGAWSHLSTTQTAELGNGEYARGSIANALAYHGDPRSLIENAVGGTRNDVIVGNIAANDLKGGAGSDRLYGLEGNDILSGGSGKDIFVFNTAPNQTSNLDRIVDFSVVDDTIYLENSVFTKLGDAGKLSSAAFWIGSKAHDSTDRVIYDSGHGGLYYDADGTGGTASVEIAQLSKGLKMTSADFIIT